MTTIHRSTLTILFLLVALGLPNQSKASVTTDLQALVSQANDLQSVLAGTTLSADAICAPLVSADQAAHQMVESIESINNALTAPITVDETLLTALDDLSFTHVLIADESIRLTGDVQLLAPVLDALSIKDGLVAMLQLSDDIGAMADRIGEMADNILVMADRIILTQEIQSQNLALTQESLLQSQTNILNLVSVVESGSYDFDLNTLTVDTTTLTGLINLSIMATSISTVLEGYNLTVTSQTAPLMPR